MYTDIFRLVFSHSLRILKSAAANISLRLDICNVQFLILSYLPPHPTPTHKHKPHTHTYTKRTLWRRQRHRQRRAHSDGSSRSSDIPNGENSAAERCCSCWPHCGCCVLSQCVLLRMANNTVDVIFIYTLYKPDARFHAQPENRRETISQRDARPLRATAIIIINNKDRMKI